MEQGIQAGWWGLPSSSTQAERNEHARWFDIRVDSALSRMVLLAAAVAYVVVMGMMVVRRHALFSSNAFDLGIYDQAIWLLSQGITPYCSIRGLHVFGDHFTPVLLPLALLYRCGMTISGLLWLQTVVLATGAWPLYRIGCRLSGSAAVGLTAAAGYLLYTPLQCVNLFDFHPIALATPGLIFALDFALERRAGPMIAACLWIVCCKQEAALVVACLGIWYAYQWRQPKALFLTVGGLVWCLIATRLLAYYAGSEESQYVELYSQYGWSLRDQVKTFLFKPWVPARTLFSVRTLLYLLALLAPLALLPLRTPGILWLMAVPFALNIFSNRPAMQSTYCQYTALLTPVLFVAAVIALSRLPQGRARGTAAFAWIACALVLGQGTGTAAARFSGWGMRLSAEERAATREALALIPPEASVSASQRMVPHLARRTKVHLFPNPYWAMGTGSSRQALNQMTLERRGTFDAKAFRRELDRSQIDYLVLGHQPEVFDCLWPLIGERVVALTEVLRTPNYGLVYNRGSVWVFRRGADHAAGLRLLGLKPTDSRQALKDYLYRVAMPAHTRPPAGPPGRRAAD